MAPPSKQSRSLGLLAATTAVVLFVLALLAVLGVTWQQERAERRSGLVRDALWLEQNVRFSVAKDLELLGRMGADSQAASTEELEARAAALIRESAGLVGIALIDGEGRLRASVPARRGWPGPASEGARASALAAGNIAWGELYGAGQDRRVDAFVPWYRDGRPVGTVVGTYGLRVVLAGLVPWWLADRHDVTIRDAGGALLASRSDGGRNLSELSQQVDLELPGRGLRLRLDAYGDEATLLRSGLVAALLALTVGVLWALVVLRRHVQRRIATEEALRNEHAFRKAMEDSLHTGMRAVALDGRIVYVNAAFCRMVGYAEAELLGSRGPQPYWPPEEREAIEAALREARERGLPRTGIELRLVRRGGERFDALLYEAPLIDADGRQTGWMGSVLDITERKRARELVRQQEERLAASARLVTVGEMASTIAHEINQPLSAIASYTAGCLNLLDAGVPPGEELREALRKSAEQAQRAGRIIRRVYDFVRRREPIRAPVRIDAVVEEAIGFAEAEARKRRVRIQTALDGALPEVMADRLLLQQVVLNLLRNAMDAMASTPDERREIRVTAARGAGQITVAIADRGCGIDPAVRGQLFEPFFTTRAEGMGMGLNICRSILELHRGRVWAEPNDGGGTVFSFTLPVEGA